MVEIIRCASSVISFFSAATRRTWLWRVSESAANNYIEHVRGIEVSLLCVTNLRLSRFAFMAGNSDFIKETMKLSDDCGNL